MIAPPGGGWPAVIIVPVQLTRSRSLGAGVPLSEAGGAARAAVPNEAHNPSRTNRPRMG
jgi:hypothetical protein